MSEWRQWIEKGGEGGLGTRGHRKRKGSKTGHSRTRSCDVSEKGILGLLSNLVTKAGLANDFLEVCPKCKYKREK